MVPSSQQSMFQADGRPLYLRVAAEIRDDLAREQAGVGTRLPSERQLTERYGVSRVTIRAALGELRNRRVLSSLPARGWVVDEGVLEGARKLNAKRIVGFTDAAVQRGLQAHSQVLLQRVRAATFSEAERLRMAPGADLFELRRVRYLNDMAIALERNLIPLALQPALVTVDFSATSLYAVLGQAVPPQIPRYADYSVEARHATDEERELLGISDYIPMLSANQLTFNADGLPIELTDQAYRGDRYTFHASITD